MQWKTRKYTLQLTSSIGNVTLNVTHKKISRIIFRYDHEKRLFKVSAPLFSNQTEIKSVFYEKEKQILKLMETKRLGSSDVLYYYGLAYPNFQSMLNLDYDISKETFYELTKRRFLTYLTERVRFYEQVMAIPLSHKVRLKMMKTRWGTNAIKTRTITFNHLLIHYDPRIIDAIVIHELCHYFIGGHQDDFYRLIYRYCPDYDYLSRNLKRGNYANN